MLIIGRAKMPLTEVTSSTSHFEKDLSLFFPTLNIASTYFPKVKLKDRELMLMTKVVCDIFHFRYLTK